MKAFVATLIADGLLYLVDKDYTTLAKPVSFSKRSTLLLNGARVLGAPSGAAVVGVQIGAYLNDHYVNKDGAMDAGASVEAATGSRVLGGVAAAGYAVGSAAYHAPEAAVDYVKNNMTLDPSEVDWDRTLKPWKWF